MNRYLYYMIFLTMLISSVGYVPNILFTHKTGGSVISLFIAPIISGAFMLIMIHSLSKFPNKGLPEILENGMPKWLGKPFLLLLGIMWFWAAIAGILSLVVITLRYINPDIPDSTLVILFTIFTVWIIRFKSTTILYSLEILLIFSVPIILFIMFKSYSSNQVTWNSVIEASNYIFHYPNWNTIAATTYSFTGYVNMIIFNRVFKGRFTVLPFLGMLLVGFGTLVTIYIIPIGYLGFDAVDYYTFPWISTTDSMRMEYGVIERVMYLFLIFFFNIAILGILLHGHVGYELLKSVFSWKKATKTQLNMMHWGILLVFAVVVFLAKNQYSQHLFWFGSTFLNIRMAIELLLIIVVFILARRRAS